MQYFNLQDHLQGEYDIVFTSYGALCWLPDLKQWSDIVKRFLKPNGKVVIVEFHPTIYMFNFDTLKLEYHYFNKKMYSERDEESYTGQKKEIAQQMNFWNHPLSEVFNAMKGLRLTEFDEYSDSDYNCFPNMEHLPNGKYALKSGNALPHVYKLVFQNESK